jgi:ABC-2 type transport system ATP-binding protein
MELLVKDVSKKIKNKDILIDINLELESGNVYGLVGRNGSGKTMLFRALSGLMKIDSGEIVYNGKVLHKDMKILPNMGIVLENASLYPELTGLKNLQLLAQINFKIDTNQIMEAIERVGLDPKEKRIIKKYSLGMKQRIVLAQAIMEKPDILLLDEPTNALDDNGVELIRNVILEEKRRGALVIIASHSKEDIHLLADEVYYMDNGKIIDKVVLDED